MKDEIVFDPREVKEAQLLIRALNHPVRQQMIFILEKIPDVRSRELADVLDLYPSECSNHLTMLREVGILSYTAIGRKWRYNLNRELLQVITKQALPLLKSKAAV